MEKTINEIRAKQKNTYMVIMLIAVSIIALIFLVLFIGQQNKTVTTAAAGRLREQNTEVLKQNISLRKTVDDLAAILNDKLKRDSVVAFQSNENYKLLPNMNNNISSIKKSYEKSTYRNLDAIDAEKYITDEARRIRNEQAQRPELDY